MRAPETSPPETSTSVDTEPLELTYQKLYKPELEEAEALSGFDGYEPLGVKFKKENKLGDYFTDRLREEYLGHYQVLWNEETKEVFFSKGFFQPHLFEGYKQAEAGFRRYEARARSGIGHPTTYEFRRDPSFDYEVRHPVSTNEISKPLLTDNPSYDPELWNIASGLIRQRMRHQDSSNTTLQHLEGGGQIHFTSQDFGLVIDEISNQVTEVDSDQVWVCLHVDQRLGSIEHVAARLGHNTRIYKKRISLYTDYYSKDLIIPIGLAFDN